MSAPKFWKLFAWCPKNHETAVSRTLLKYVWHKAELFSFKIRKVPKNTIIPTNFLNVLFLTRINNFWESRCKTIIKSQYFLAQCPKEMNRRTFHLIFFSEWPSRHEKCIFENLLKKIVKRLKSFCLVPEFENKVKKFSKKKPISQNFPVQT